MLKFRLLLMLVVVLPSMGYSQFFFDVSVDPAWTPDMVVFPPSPLKHQILFIGGNDVVQTTATYGNAPGQALAKQNHDFIGFTPDEESDDLGWVSVNHEMVILNDSIGDGGGMTTFKVKRDPITDLLEVVPQTLSDGRTGEYFNVDFVNTVGETGMNCGGINSVVDGRIWTAEEWFQNSNSDIAGGVRDLSPWTISTDIPGNFAGQTIEKYENLNYMVEIDPREAMAIRKQYNWGRQPFEGGAVAADNRTVYMGADATPGLFTKFVADTPGDFRSGKLYAYKHDAPGEPWVELPSNDLSTTLNFTEEALALGATMFNRLEWVVYHDGKIYLTETGRDNIGNSFKNGAATGGVLDYHWVEPVLTRHRELSAKTNDQIIDFVMAGFFNDYYGRVLEFDPATGLVTTYLEGGPFFPSSPEATAYPDAHLSNPDGLNIMVTNGKPYMLICEDLNGTSNGRMPAGFGNRSCELYLLDMSVEGPTVEDLVRIAVTPLGSEVTGVQPTPDGKTILVNSQHPSGSNPYPYNNSLTFAITGWDEAITAITGLEELKEGLEESTEFQIWPNPVSRKLNFNEAVDAAIYNESGQRIKVFRSLKSLDVSDLGSGVYFLKTSKGVGRKLIVQ